MHWKVMRCIKVWLQIATLKTGINLCMGEGNYEWLPSRPKGINVSDNWKRPTFRNSSSWFLFSGCTVHVSTSMYMLLRPQVYHDYCQYCDLSYFCMSCLYTWECAIGMMTSLNGSIFRVTGPLCGEITGHRWIPLTKACNVELWCFLWSAPE